MEEVSEGTGEPGGERAAGAMLLKFNGGLYVNARLVGRKSERLIQQYGRPIAFFIYQGLTSVLFLLFSFKNRDLTFDATFVRSVIEESLCREHVRCPPRYDTVRPLTSVRPYPVQREYERAMR